MKSRRWMKTLIRDAASETTTRLPYERGIRREAAISRRKPAKPSVFRRLTA